MSKESSEKNVNASATTYIIFLFRHYAIPIQVLSVSVGVSTTGGLFNARLKMVILSARILIEPQREFAVTH